MRSPVKLHGLAEVELHMVSNWLERVTQWDRAAFKVQDMEYESNVEGYDGKVYGNEVMPMVALADEIAAGNKPNPYLQVFPQAEKYSTSGFQTTHTYSAVSGNAYQAGLVLSPTWRDADPE